MLAYLLTIYAPTICTVQPRAECFECVHIHYEGSGRGLGPGILEFFGPCEMASSRQASAIWGPKNCLCMSKVFINL